MPDNAIPTRGTALTNSGKPHTPRGAQLRKLLTRNSGATIVQIQKAFGWQPHTARAAISGQRKAGHVVERDGTGKASVYRIIQPGCA